MVTVLLTAIDGEYRVNMNKGGAVLFYQNEAASFNFCSILLLNKNISTEICLWLC